jgi:hypothetical protein
MNTLSKKGKHYLLVLSFTLAIIILYVYKLNLPTNNKKLKDNYLSIYSRWPKFSIGSDKYILECFNNDKTKPSLKLLSKLIYYKHERQECEKLASKIKNIYDIQIKISKIDLPKSFEAKVKNWLGNNEQLFKEIKTQVILSH